MSHLICPSCKGLLPSPDAPCPRCGYGQTDLLEDIGARTPRDAALIAGVSLAAGVLLLLGGPVAIWLWDQLGGEATWGWLAALLCAGGGLAAMARGARILVAYVSWRRKQR